MARALRPSAGSLGLTALFLLALALRLAGAGWGLPHVYEEAMPLKVAWKLWAWGEPHGFNGDPKTLGYPSLVFYLEFIAQVLLFAALRVAGAIQSALDFRVLFALDKTPFVLVGRAVSALLGAGLVPATFLLARRLGGVAAGWVAAGLVAVAPVLVLRSTEIEVDLPLAFFVTLGCVQALRLLERPTVRNAVLAGLLTGLAASSKYPGFILLVPFSCAVALADRGETERVARAMPAPQRRLGPRRRPAPASSRLRSGAPGFSNSRPGLVLVVISTAVLTFLATSPYVLIHRDAFWRDIANHREHMASGHFGVEGGRAFLFNAGALANRLLGWPLALLALAGAVTLAAGERRREAIVAMSLPVSYLAIVGLWTMKADRYLLLLVPVAIAFAMAGASRMMERAGPEVSPRRATVLWVLVTAMCAVPFVLQPAWREWFERLRPDRRTEALAWIQAHAPEGALIAAEEYAPDIPSFTTPELMDPEVAPRLAGLARRPNVYAVQHVPMFQVEPERSAAFYDLELFSAADLFVVTSSVRARYEADRVRYGPQCSFYDSLERRWPRVAHFAAAGHAGPEISIHRNPDHEGWYPSRQVVPAPVAVADRGSGLENFFYWNLGVNYESGGHLDRAIDAYRIGLQYIPRSTDLDLYTSIGARLAYCLLGTRTPAESRDYLRSASIGASVQTERQILEWLAGLVERDPSQFSKLAIPRIRG